MKKTIFYILLLFILTFQSSNAITEEELKEYTQIDFYDFVNSYNSNSNFNIKNKNVINDFSNNRKIEITKTDNISTYLNPVGKYIANLEYRSNSKRVDIYQKPFLLTWFKLSNSNTNNYEENSAESILADDNFDLFYTSTLYSTRGKNFYLTTQKAINDLMAQDLKNGDKIKVYLWNLGQHSNNTPVFIVVGYKKTPTTISQAISDEASLKDFMPTLKEDILNRKYDEVKGKLELLLKKYPKNLDLKLNLCLINNNTGYYEKAINCYKEVLKLNNKSYDAYYGISMAYYNDKSLDDKSKISNVILNTTKAIDIIEGITSNPKGSLAMIIYNCYYLRAMAKIMKNDTTAIDDLIIIYKNHPTLVSRESIDLYEKKIGYKQTN